MAFFCEYHIIWLVVWNMNFIFFPYIGNVIIPTDKLIFFRGVETTNQMMLGCWLILPLYCHDMHIFFFGCSWFIGPTGFVHTWWICHNLWQNHAGEHDVLNPWFPMLGQAHSDI